MEDQSSNQPTKRDTMKNPQTKENNTGRSAPFGYSWSRDGLVESKPEQEILDTINKLRETGLTTAQVADMLVAKGYLAKRGARWVAADKVH